MVCGPFSASQSIAEAVFLTRHVTSCRPKWDGVLKQALHASADVGVFFFVVVASDWDQKPCDDVR